MKTYIITLPNEISIKDGVISITGPVGWSAIEKAVHNAKEAIEIDGLRDHNDNFVDKREGTDLYRVTFPEVPK